MFQYKNPIVVLTLAATVCISCGETGAQTDIKSQLAKIDAAWNKTFEKFKTGWTGGDGAGTIDLGDGRTVWLFGDSLIGTVKEGKHAAGTHMINNAIAIQKINDDRRPAADQFQFAWGAKDAAGKPTAWVVPDPQKVKPTVPITNKKYPHGWYWPAGGGCLIETATKDKKQKKLITFMFHVGRTAQDRGVWSFKNIGGAMVVVDHPEKPVNQWKPRQLDLPFTVDIDQVELARKESRKEVYETTWGMSCLVEPASDRSGNKTVYIFGARQKTKFNRQLLVARVPASRIEDFKSWRFFAGENRWSKSASEAKPIANQMAAEFSVHVVAVDGKRKFVLIQSDPMLGTKIYARTADSPAGPWSKRIVLYDVPDVRKSKNYFTYAAKAHLELSPRGKLVVSYVVNSQDFWEMLRDASIYRPRFVTVSIKELFKER